MQDKTLIFKLIYFTSLCPTMYNTSGVSEYLLLAIVSVHFWAYQQGESFSWCFPDIWGEYNSPSGVIFRTGLSQYPQYYLALQLNSWVGSLVGEACLCIFGVYFFSIWPIPPNCKILRLGDMDLDFWLWVICTPYLFVYILRQCYLPIFLG